MHSRLVLLAGAFVLFHPTLAEAQREHAAGVTADFAAQSAEPRISLPLAPVAPVRFASASESSGRFWKPTVVGTAVGTTVGILLGYSFDNEQVCYPENCPPTRDYWWKTGLVGAGAGALVGALTAWAR